MKKLWVILAACFAFVGAAYAAVDLNTATQAELESVKGIGPTKAKAIIDYRTKNGPFKSVDELDNVKGFGDKSVDKARTELTVGGRSSAKAVEKSGEKTKPVDKASEKAKPADMAKPAEKATDTAADKEKADKKAAKKAKKSDKDEPAADDKKEAGKK